MHSLVIDFVVENQLFAILVIKKKNILRADRVCRQLGEIETISSFLYRRLYF